jgi:hypothetical protein
MPAADLEDSSIVSSEIQTENAAPWEPADKHIGAWRNGDEN